jgi:hypothetical protein
MSLKQQQLAVVAVAIVAITAVPFPLPFQAW